MRHKLGWYPALLTTLVLGCLPQQDSRQRLLDAARDLNVAARFGRMDVAAEHAAPASKRQFLERHNGWGRTLRVVDVNLEGIQMKDNDEADVHVTVQWTFINEGVLRTTMLKQLWGNHTKAGWRLEREQHADGDRGLLGETVAQRPDTSGPRPDVHFQTKTLGKD